MKSRLSITACASIFLILGSTNHQCGAAPVAYDYTGNSYTFATAPYTTSMFVTATLRLDNPLPSDLSLTDITGSSGFVLTLNDGIRTLTTTSPEVNIGSAFVSTDATGSIVGWQLGLHIVDDVVILSANFSSGMSDSSVDFPTATENAYVAGNAGTWTGPTVIPIPPALYLFGSGLLGLVGISRGKKIRTE